MSVSASGLAVPMFMSRKTCAESTLIISTGKRCVSAIATPVLPLAVGPSAGWFSGACAHRPRRKSRSEVAHRAASRSDGRGCTGRRARSLPSGAGARSSRDRKDAPLARTAPWQAIVASSSLRCAAISWSRRARAVRRARRRGWWGRRPAAAPGRAHGKLRRPHRREVEAEVVQGVSVLLGSGDFERVGGKDGRDEQRLRAMRLLSSAVFSFS